MSTTGLTSATGGYYSIPTTSTAGSTASASTLSAAQSVAQQLLQAESASTTTGGDTVDLSPAAQSLLGGSTSSDSGGFLLSQTQEQQITTILQHYASAPNTQATFDAIQDALKADGLSPDELEAKDIQTSGSSTALQIIEEFNGQTPSAAPTFSDEQAKATSYINQIYAQFEQVVALNGTASSTGSTAAATTGTGTDTTA